MTQEPSRIFEALPQRIILDNGLRGGRTLVFENPHRVIACTDPAEFSATLRELEDARARGHHLAGFFSYEAGYLLEEALTQLLPEDREAPLIWFAVFDEPTEWTATEREQFFNDNQEASVSNVTRSLDQHSYVDKVDEVRELIAAGDIYQANVTFQANVTVEGAPSDLYARLRHAQPVPHGALIEAKDWAVLSMSPELFFETQNGEIIARPMKGTAARAMTEEEDSIVAAQLPNDPKERAENLMILDLIRNDLSKIATPGSVDVPSRFDVETYRTIHQMTSTVTANLKTDCTVSDVFSALFPCGSITGAPKVRAMQIIRDLETAPRGIYTGAIGMFAPSGAAAFNVAIRTLTLTEEADRKWHGTVGVGGGIVYDSTPQGEWHECELKLSFLNDVQAAELFDLIESLLWTKRDGYSDLDLHLERLKSTAHYFDFELSMTDIERALHKFADGLSQARHKVRLLLSEDGKQSITQTPVSEAPLDGWQFTLTDRPVNSRDPHRYHKTTKRQLLDMTRERLARATGCDEVIFVNERGELTEGSYTNLFIERNGKWLTPRRDCGLLNGILRQKMLLDPDLDLQEVVVTPQDLVTADRIFLGNSVRGLIQVTAVTPSARLVGQ